MKQRLKSLFPESLIAEQYRMSLLQVYNWGTFSDLHSIPIAKEGFLFVGRSGSGKSTLLDALSALLVPPQWRGFNAAARDGDKGKHDRNLAFYVRGAWGNQTDADSGEIATQFLRTGTTWSALALEYRTISGKIITLVALYILRGQHTRSTDVHSHFMIAERSFDLKTELSDFSADLDIRKLKQKLVDVFHADKFKPYSERLCMLLNIDNEMALKLLHKTQSAKNLGDLNLFLREYMLEEPETFSVADRLISEFAELDAAHQTVVIARDQVKILSLAREEYLELQNADQTLLSLDELRAGIDIYCINRQKELLHIEINKLETEKIGAVGQEKSQQEIVDQLKDHLRRLENQHRAEGGERIEILKTEILRAEQNKQQRLEKRSLVAQACEKLALTLPNNSHGYAELISHARDFNESWQQSRENHENKRDELRDKKREITEEFSHVRQEVDSLRRQPSNIPSQMLALRQRIAAAAGLQDTDLPFAGELIEVREEEAPWRGAIERVLHGFALSLLVSERHYALILGFVNETQLGNRLVYYRIGQLSDAHGLITQNSLFHKIIFKKNENAHWLENEIKRRFNYTCVDSLQELRKTERALTREGLVRHSQSQHEKDDRRIIDDKKHWILGFDNQEKLRLYEQKAHLLADELNKLDNEIKAIEESQQKQYEKATIYHSIVNIAWNEIDVASSLDQVAALQHEFEQLHMGNAALKLLDEKIIEQEKIVKQKEIKLTEIKSALHTLEMNIKNYRAELEKLEIQPIIQLTPWQQSGLDEYFQRQALLSLKNIHEIVRKVENAITTEHQKISTIRAEQKNTIERIFQQFKNRWPQDGADLDASLASTAEFLAKLTRIELDGLPAHEERFFNMLRNQSVENLAALSTHLSQARKDIIHRMELVNESLAEANYNPGTHLKIEVSDRQLEAVKYFRTQIREVLDYALGDDRDFAEQRFATLRSLVNQLSGQDPEQQRWRLQVLDVRLHVEFLAKEYDAAGKELEVYQSGAGKSGGQREKLATTCLAAALCYQLGGQQGGVPLYAAVVLDEAFSKADNEFTQEVMKVFMGFGFQMIVATPFKSVMTLEPFIAGACVVEIDERKCSRTMQISYNHSEKCLDLPRETTT